MMMIHVEAYALLAVFDQTNSKKEHDVEKSVDWQNDSRQFLNLLGFQVVLVSNSRFLRKIDVVSVWHKGLGNVFSNLQSRFLWNVVNFVLPSSPFGQVKYKTVLNQCIEHSEVAENGPQVNDSHFCSCRPMSPIRIMIINY